MQEGYEAWLATRPESVRRLAAEFPPMTTIEILDRGDGTPVKLWVMGWDEDDHLLVHDKDPRAEGEYEKGVASRRKVCAAHVRAGAVKLLKRGERVEAKGAGHAGRQDGVRWRVEGGAVRRQGDRRRPRG